MVDRFYAAAVALFLLVTAVFIGLVLTSAYHGLSASVTAPPPARAEARVVPHPLGCGCCDRCGCGR